MKTNQIRKIKKRRRAARRSSNQLSGRVGIVLGRFAPTQKVERKRKDNNESFVITNHGSARLVMFTDEVTN